MLGFWAVLADVFREEGAGWGVREVAGGGKKWKMAGKRSRVWPGSGWGVEGGPEGGGEGMGGQRSWHCAHPPRLLTLTSAFPGAPEAPSPMPTGHLLQMGVPVLQAPPGWPRCSPAGEAAALWAERPSKAWVVIGSQGEVSWSLAGSGIHVSTGAQCQWEALK